VLLPEGLITEKEKIMKDFKEKVAVVTGGASGIGLGIAKALAKAGAHIVVADIQEDKALQAATELAILRVHSSAFTCDVTDRSSVEKLADHAWTTFGHVDIIVNNAGVMTEGCPLVDGKESDFRWLLDVNLIGEWNGCSIFGKRFIEQGTEAHILNTASENSFYVAVPYSGFYVATKHAVLGMSDSLRMEMPEFVNVSILACGLVNTNLSSATEMKPERFGGPVIQDEETKKSGKQVMGLGMDPDEIGRLTVEGMQRGDFYIVTHPHNRDYIADRYEEILRAYDTYAPHFEGDEKYDVRKIMARMMSKED
jgi:NAD(P)-dependent dehydrogenase (short-subunit alcohol dehydrogenase family)